jgi:hypothetical protein
MNDVNSLLKEAYNATAVIVMPGSGSYGMEAVARQWWGSLCLLTLHLNTLPPGPATRSQLYARSAPVDMEAVARQWCNPATLAESRMLTHRPPCH